MTEHPQRHEPPGETSASPDRGPQQLAEPTIQLDLSREIRQLHAESSWQRGDRNAKTLVKHPHLHLTLVVLKAGARLDQHQTVGPVAIQPFAGRVRLRVAGEQRELTPGQMLVLGANLPHDVEAVEESALLLTIGWPE